MIHEEIDKHSGAILFKKDEDSINIEKIYKKIESLEKKNRDLEKRIKKLEESS